MSKTKEQIGLDWKRKKTEIDFKVRYNHDCRTSNVISISDDEQTNKCCNLSKCFFFLFRTPNFGEMKEHDYLFCFYYALFVFVSVSLRWRFVIMTVNSLCSQKVGKLMSLNRKNDSDYEQMRDEMQLRTKESQ